MLNSEANWATKKQRSLSGNLEHMLSSEHDCGVMPTKESQSTTMNRNVDNDQSEESIVKYDDSIVESIAAIIRADDETSVYSATTETENLNDLDIQEETSVTENTNCTTSTTTKNNDNKDLVNGLDDWNNSEKRNEDLYEVGSDTSYTTDDEGSIHKIIAIQQAVKAKDVPTSISVTLTNDTKNVSGAKKSNISAVAKNSSHDEKQERFTDKQVLVTCNKPRQTDVQIQELDRTNPEGGPEVGNYRGNEQKHNEPDKEAKRLPNYKCDDIPTNVSSHAKEKNAIKPRQLDGRNVQDANSEMNGQTSDVSSRNDQEAKKNATEKSIDATKTSELHKSKKKKVKTPKSASGNDNADNSDYLDGEFDNKNRTPNDGINGTSCSLHSATKKVKKATKSSSTNVTQTGIPPRLSRAAPPRPDLRVQFGNPTLMKYNRPLRHDDIVMVPSLFGSEEDRDTYSHLMDDISALQQRGVERARWVASRTNNYLVCEDVLQSPTIQKIVAKVSEYFYLREESIMVKLEMFRNGGDYQTPEHDILAYHPKEKGGIKRNIVVYVSFGAEREMCLVRKDNNNNENKNSAAVIYFPQRNNGAFSVGRDVNVRFQNGVVTPDGPWGESSRICVRVYGRSKKILSQDGSPDLLKVGGDEE